VERLAVESIPVPRQAMHALTPMPVQAVQFVQPAPPHFRQTTAGVPVDEGVAEVGLAAT
jgi:hypothetical protein